MNSLDEEDNDEEGEGESNSEEDSEIDLDLEENRGADIITEPVFDTPNPIRITPPFLTKYEKARVIGVRATQISKNSPLYLNADDSKTSFTQRISATGTHSTSQRRN